MTKRARVEPPEFEADAKRARPLAYVALVHLLTVPFWALGYLANVRLLPGVPVSALAVTCPALAAMVLCAQESGRSGVFRLLCRALDARKAGWRLPVVAMVNPLLFATAYGLAQLGGARLPLPGSTLVSGSGLLLIFLITGLLEEIGWTGYALSPLQTRHGSLGAALILGVVTSLWHYPALVQVGRATDWIAWWTLWTVSERVIRVHLHDWAGKSVFAVALCHAMSNLCWQLYPVQGSAFDPRLSGLVTLAAALLLTLRAPRRSGPVT